MHPNATNTVSALLLIAAATPAQGQFFAASTPLTFGTPPSHTVKGLTMTRDERLAVFATDRPGGAGGFDLWTSSRAAVGLTWGPATPLANLNSAAHDDGPGLSADGLELYFSSTRGGIGPRTLFVARRVSRMAPWRAPAAIPPLNAHGVRVRDPQPSDNGLVLFYASDVSGTYDLYRSQRPDLSSPWSAGTRINALSTMGADEIGPAPEAQGSILWFSSDRGGGAGGFDLYLAWFGGSPASWSTPLPVTERNTANDETGMFIAASSLISYHDSILGGPLIECICRGTGDVRTLGSDDGWVEGNSGGSYTSWQAPLVLSVGQTWEMTTTKSLSFYDWKGTGGGGGANTWVSFLSAQRLAAPLPLPFLTDGALALDPTTMIPLAVTLQGPNGQGLQTLPIPFLPGAAGQSVWLQSVLVRASGELLASPAHRVTFQ